MGYIFLIMTWLLAGAVWGGMVVVVGPGILMLLVGAIVAGCGCLYSLSERLFGYQLNYAWAGLSIFFRESDGHNFCCTKPEIYRSRPYLHGRFCSYSELFDSLCSEETRD